MAAHFMCLTSSGGIPLFTRQKGEGDTMTFSKMASLNGIHMFLKSQNVTLLHANLPDTTVVWREFEQSVVLIVIASGATEYVLQRFLNAAFGAMILFVGIDEIKNSKNVERLKKDMRVCNPIIDRLLECLDVGDKIYARTDIAYMTECLLSQENHLFQPCLDGYMECLDSIYGCLLMHGSLAIATDGWWSLEPLERKLLITAITTQNNCTARDLPVFLPHKSPNIAFRLVSITLINHVEVLALCGPTPELPEVERFAIQYWKSSLDALRTAEQCYPRNIPSTITLDNGVLGFLMINQKVDKFVLGRNSQCSKNRITGAHRLDILRTFYHQAVETFILSEETNKQDFDEFGCGGHTQFLGAKEMYLCSEYHKCHAMKDGDNILCVLYVSAVPTHTMRLITHKIMKLYLTDKQICW